jgi:putative DNA methylase
LAEEVRDWGNWVLKKVKAEIGDLYPPIPDPKAPKIREVLGEPQLEMSGHGFESAGQQRLAVETPAGYLTPVAYLWTRTVRCKNPSCGAIVPLVRPNQWTHWGEGGFGSLSILLPEGEQKPLASLPSEIRFLTDLLEGKTLGEEITLTILDRISYEPDRWS